MGNDLRTSLQELRQLAPQLNQVADEAAVIVREVENLLVTELSLGIPARVTVSWTDRPNGVSEFVFLAHERVAGKFRIAVIEADRQETPAECTEEITSARPWAECPRDLKLESFEKLPELLEQIVKTATQMLQSAEKAKGAVREIMGPQDGKKPSSDRPSLGLGDALTRKADVSAKVATEPDTKTRK